MIKNINDAKEFEFKLRTLLKTYTMIDMSDTLYIISYLSFIIKKINCSLLNQKYKNFENFINEVSKNFQIMFDNKVIVGTDKEIVKKSVEFLKNYQYIKIDINVLTELLNNTSIEIYEAILINNLINGYSQYGYYSTNNEIINLYKYFITGNEILDIGCGMGNTLIELVKNNQVNKADGVEINSTKKLISEIRLSLLHENKSKIIEGDYLTTFIDSKYSFITCNMPFGLHINSLKKNEIISKFDNNLYFKWKITPAMSSEWLFINKALTSLKKDGRIVLLTTQTPLYRDGDYNSRKDLIDSNLIEYVIEMPANTYPGTNINYSIVVLNNNKINNDVKFFNASEYYYELKHEKIIDYEKILNEIDSGSDNIKIVSNAEIKSNGYVLLTRKYIENKQKLKNAVKISDLDIKVLRGYQLFTKSDIDENGNYSIITISDIDDSGNLSDKLNRFNTDKDLSKYQIKKNDILISTKGTKIKTCIINQPIKNTIYHGNMSLIRVNDNRINPLFLKLYLDSLRGQLELKSIQTGTGIISINSSQLSNIEIPLLDINIQNKIVSNYILKKAEIDVLQKKIKNLYDDLIEITKIFEEEI